MPKSIPQDQTTCLNGWWDVQPASAPHPTPQVPATGWLAGQYLVPSFWTQSAHGVRRRGETYYHARHDPAIFASDEFEFLFDAFGYPPAWSASRAGWVRRALTLDALAPDRRYALVVDAVMPQARVFVNGDPVARHRHPTLPLEVDVTDRLRAGENELAILIEDYDRDAKGRALVPTGNVIPCDHSGVWQDVSLVSRPALHVSDVTIRTSTRQGTLTVRVEVTNRTAAAQNVTLAPEVRDWQPGVAPADAAFVRALPATRLRVPAGARATAQIEAAWPDAVRWSPATPHLYWLCTVLRRSAAPSVMHAERFGFREVWIDGPDLMLNGTPVHLFSDWGHKPTPYYYTEGWIRQWFGMLRDANMNHSRLHTHPHPRIYMDLADEAGILITGETGLHGSGGAQAAASPQYWEAAQDHVRRFVRRDKNHPCIVLWSVENEMRWNTKGRDAAQENAMIRAQLPRLRALFNELDPTRPAYHDGDSSLWNETTQPIVSRHYGKEVAGIGWWDRERPLHSGEMALYHYAGPNNTLHLGGDAVYASFAALDRAAARDAALIIAAGRTLGVSCFGPWNLSCLENLRMTSEDVTLDYDDVTTPGVKPLRVPAHASEFTFWREGKGYTPHHSFPIQAHAFRPVAVIDRSLKSGYFAGSAVRRELFVVNDGPEALEGTLTVRLGDLPPHTAAVSVPRGRVVKEVVEFPLPEDAAPGPRAYTATLHIAGEVVETWTREIRLGRRALRPGQLGALPPLAVYGPGLSRPALDALALDYAYVDALDAAALAGFDLLLMERNTVEAGSPQNRRLRDFVRRGGRLVLLEQVISPFPEAPLTDLPVLTAFRRAPDHPVLAGLAEADLAFWGEDPYPLLASDAYVARKLYRKDDGRLMLPLLDAGEGGFGSGDLEHTPLFEAAEGDGLILACQLRITDKLADTPAAERLFLNLLRRAAAYTPPTADPPLLVAGAATEGLARYRAEAEAGRTVIVEDATPAALTAWGDALGLPLRPRDVGEVYQVVRAAAPPADKRHPADKQHPADRRHPADKRHPADAQPGHRSFDTEDQRPVPPLLAGVSHWDTCGIETFSYTPRSAANHEVGTTFLAPVDGLEALLVTPTESCLRELFVYGGRSEALRAHTLSRFLYAERRPEAVALGRVSVGEGAVLFNQVAPPRERRARFTRLRHRLQANLGRRFEGSLLAGEAVPLAPATSPGYPQQLHAYAGPCDAALYRHMVESTRPTMERMLTTPILTLAAWTAHTAEEGVWRAADLLADRPGADLYLYYPVWSPTPRKNVDTNLDVPNPEALTFLDLEGDGVAEVTVNGHTYAPLALEGGRGTVSDIPLEMGGNHVLIRWTIDVSEAPDATLAMRWRNIMRQPEVRLRFGAGGSEN